MLAYFVLNQVDSREGSLPKSLSWPEILDKTLVGNELFELQVHGQQILLSFGL